MPQGNPDKGAVKENGMKRLNSGMKNPLTP